MPAVLKSLGYPFNVSKNHMLNVGSPHSWPILLGAIMWLVDVSVQCGEEGSDDSWMLFFHQCCSVVDNTSQLLFYKGSGFTDEEEQENPDLVSTIGYRVVCHRANLAGHFSVGLAAILLVQYYWCEP